MAEAATARHLRAVPRPAPNQAERRLAAGAIAEAAERLAAPSPVVRGVLELLDDPSTPVRLIAARLGQSPELAARTLRMANSAHFSDAVVSLERAVVRIGERPLRGLLLAASTYGLLEGALAVYRLPRLALLRHCAETAAMAQQIARRTSAALAPQAYLAGLLHDLGKPILAAVVGDRVVPEGTPDVAWERAAFLTDHARVAGWVARRWSLTDELAGAIACHHDPAPPEHPLERVVWLADLLVHAAHGHPEAIERAEEAAAACGLGREPLEELLSASGDGAESPRRPPGLTEREIQVLRLLASGAAAKQVAGRLGCSASTVHNHLHHVYRKLGVTGQAQALLLAREHGWV